MIEIRTLTVGEAIQIASFLILAGLTYWYARQTKKMAGTSERAALAAQDSARSAEELLKLEFLPIVWATTGSVSSSSRGHTVEVWASNSGRGVALRVHCTIFPGEGDPVGAIVADHLVPTTGRQKRVFDVDERTFRSIQIGDYTMAAAYYDTTGRKFKTQGWVSTGSLIEVADDGSETVVFQFRQPD